MTSKDKAILPNKKIMTKIKWKWITHQWKSDPPIFRFLDPFQNYRLFGDVVFTNKICQCHEPIYSFELYRDYKALRQIHVRENGIILELEDYDEYQLSSISFVKSRLKTLGDKEASDFADFLESYENYFNTNEETKKNSKIPIEDPMKIFGWIDKVFEKHQEDLIFIRGSKLLGMNGDFRIRYICYNFKMLEWITNENNFFSDEFIRNCERIFFFRNLEEYTNIMKSIINSKKAKFGDQAQTFPKYINSLIGKIEILVKIKTKFFPEQQLLFHYFNYSKKDHDPNFVETMSLVKFSKREMENKNAEEEKDYSKKYIRLMKLYYLNPRK